MADRVVTSHIPVALAREVDKLAARLGRPRRWVVKQALSRYVAREQQRHDLTQEALDDVDAGRVVDHAEIEAWADTLTGSAIAPHGHGAGHGPSGAAPHRWRAR